MKIIDLSIIKKNVNDYSKGHILWAVLKNDAYGLGLSKIGEYLISIGVNNFVVISLNEAILLRKMSDDINILLLGLIPYDRLDEINKYRIIVSINRVSDIGNLPNNILREYKLNTSLNRFGLSKEELPLGKIRVYSHLAISDDLIVDEFLRCGYNHIGSTKLPKGKEIRIGYGLYKDAIKIYEEIVYIRHVKKESYIGYDYYTNSDCIVGIINIGYYDGLLKANSGRYVFINDKRYKILSICMNHTFILIDESIKEFDNVEIVGENITIEEIAKYLSTSPYEVLVSFRDMKKRYI